MSNSVSSSPPIAAAARARPRAPVELVHHASELFELRGPELVRQLRGAGRKGSRSGYAYGPAND